MWFASRSKAAQRDAGIARQWQERSELLDEVSGAGLWDAVLPDGDARHPDGRWTWSPGFRRLIGAEHDAEFPNAVQALSDRLHPSDVAPTFAALDALLADRTGTTRFDVTCRIKVRDGSYRWFRATGGCRRSAEGGAVRACGSLVDVHPQMVAEAALAEAEAERGGIEALGRALAAFADGNLSVQVAQPFGPKGEPLRLDFNRAASAMRQVLEEIGLKQEAIRAGAAAIAGAADDLSGRTEQQAASLEETAAALDQITVTVRKTAEGAKHARDVVGTAKGDAERSGEVVRRAVEAMSSIDKSSGQIGQIIGVIDEIAFQTNLLALNAGVEAARAGEAGRGFAVVASEVRALAQRSAEAAKEIKALITASDAQVKAGVGLVGETGRALNRIVEQVGEINTAVAEIAASAGEQAAGLQQVNTAVNQMDQVTQRNAAMVEETTAAARGLGGDADELARLTERFRLGEPAPRPRPVPARAPVREAARPVPARKPVGRGGAARKPEPAADAEWEEF